MEARLKLKKSLLATSCFAALSVGQVQATPFIELDSAPGGDFSNELDTATLIPSGTTSITGSIPSSSNPFDFSDAFYLDGLTPGSVVNLYQTNPQGYALGIYSALDFASSLSSLFYEDGASVTVGSSGIIAFYVNTEGSPVNYSITVDYPSANVPVAPTAALLGMGVVGMELRRRKHGGKSSKA